MKHLVYPSSKVFAITESLLGFIVLISWYFKQTLIIQLHTSAAPKHFNLMPTELSLEHDS